MGWLIALAVIAAVLFLPVGFRAIYNQNGFMVWLQVGPVRFRVYPEKKQAKKSKKTAEQSGAKALIKGGRFADFLPIARTLYAFIAEFRRRLLVKRLELKLILAGDDPADLAINYGRASAAVGNVIPRLDRFLRIRKRSVEIECDFAAEETVVYARIDATLTLVRAVHLLSKHGVKLIKQLMELKKLRKGGAQL